MNAKIEIRNRNLHLRDIIQKINRSQGTLYKNLDFLDNDMADTGLYIMKDLNGAIQYVGKGDCQTLTRRLTECLSNDRKFGSIVKKVKNRMGFNNLDEARNYIKDNWTVIIIPFQRHSVEGEIMTNKFSNIRITIRSLEDRLIHHFDPPFNMRRNNQFYLREGINTRFF